MRIHRWEGCPWPGGGGARSGARWEEWTAGWEGGDARFSHVCAIVCGHEGLLSVSPRMKSAGWELWSQCSGVGLVLVPLTASGMIRAEKAKLKFVLQKCIGGGCEWWPPQSLCNAIVNSSPLQNVLCQE